MDNNKDGLWKVIERFKTIAELIATLIVIFPILSALIQQGLNATMPVWLVLVVAIFAILLGYLFGRTSRISQNIPRNHKHELLQKIDFDYSDSPVEHKWHLGESTDETQPSFLHFPDGFVGKALEIKSTVRYRMDFFVDQLASLGSYIEFVAKLENESYFQTCIRVQSKDSSNVRKLWLSFCAGTEQPKRIDDGSDTWYEYVVNVIPTQLEGGWARFELDLIKAVQLTAGKEGWKFGQLERVRLRGNISIAHISIFKE